MKTSINNIQFGTSDADTELIRTPKIFTNAFFDPDNNINELINGYKFVVIGRKGDGKSAYYARMKCLSDSDSQLETIGESLEKLNSSFFEKFTDKDLTGGKRYVPMWKCIILIELIKYIELRGFGIQKENYLSIVDALSRAGLLTSNSIEQTITQLESTDITLSAANWISYGRHREKNHIMKGANDIYSVILNELKSIHIGSIKFRMVFDGLDDILRAKQFNIDIITGLLRAADEINRAFDKKELKFKTIILIRSDIFDLCRDPDISKIRFGSTIDLSWLPNGTLYESNLANLVLARFNMDGTFYTTFKDIWNTYFPMLIDNKDSFEYMIENTLYKPRDILMFFSLTQKMMPRQDRQLTEYEFKLLLNNYSREYFIVHMQDELTGFIPDEAINELQTVFSRVGSRRFSFESFSNEMSQNKVFSSVCAEDVLRIMFERGYIGQYRKRPGHPKEEFYFQININSREKYQKEDDCQLHRGLIRAFGI